MLVRDRPLSIYLHIGPPKTGTTYLQQVLWQNRGRLVRADVTCPGSRGDHFQAALDLRELAFGGFENPKTRGAWPRLAEHTLAVSTSRAVISHEVFAGAEEEQIVRLVTDLDGTAVHVVYGARDLARQLPAVWQESLKNRRTSTYRAFLRRTLGDDGSPGEAHFWRAQDAVATLGRWSKAVPADRIHVVTVPPSGTAPDTLWRRFCQVLGISPEGFDLETSRANPSLTSVDAELLRRLNDTLPDDLPWPAYERSVKRWFNHRADSGRAGDRLRVPTEHRERVLALSAQQRSGLSDAGYDIVGGLDELVPLDAGFGPVETVSSDMVTDTAVGMLADVLLERRRAGRESQGGTVQKVLGRLRQGRGGS